MYFRRKQSQGRIYLQIVESHRTGDQVRQRVIATLGRLDELEASGQLDRLLRSGARFVRQAMVLDAARTGEVPAVAVRRIGPTLLFERLAALAFEVEAGGVHEHQVEPRQQISRSRRCANSRSSITSFRQRGANTSLSLAVMISVVMQL
jgi:HEAT repeat protein